METYKSVSLSGLQKAFGLAHKASVNPDFPIGTRNVFRAIAHQIWTSCGEDRAMPAVLPPDFPGTVTPEPEAPEIAYWKSRGRNDALNNRPVLQFDDTPDKWSPEETEAKKAAYSAGYDEALG